MKEMLLANVAVSSTGWSTEASVNPVHSVLEAHGRAHNGTPTRVQPLPPSSLTFLILHSHISSYIFVFLFSYKVYWAKYMLDDDVVFIRPSGNPLGRDVRVCCMRSAPASAWQFVFFFISFWVEVRNEHATSSAQRV